MTSAPLPRTGLLGVFRLLQTRERRKVVPGVILTPDEIVAAVPTFLLHR